MRLAKLSEFRRPVYSPHSAPSMRTLRAHIQEIPGGIVEAGHYYIDLDEYDRAHALRAGIAARRTELAKDPLLEGLI